MTPDGSGRGARRHDDGPSPTEDASPAQGGESVKDGENGRARRRPESSGSSGGSSADDVDDVDRAQTVSGASGPVAGRPRTTGAAARAHWTRRRQQEASPRRLRRRPPQPTVDPEAAGVPDADDAQEEGGAAEGRDQRGDEHAEADGDDLGAR